MTPEQREELKRAAQAATPGPWRKGPSGGIYTEGPDSFGILSALTPSGSLRNASANEEYAALADPAAILSLIAQVEALNRKNLELQRVHDERGLQIERLEVALQRAKVEALTVPQWQPIATAPQDGYMLVHEDGAIRAKLRFNGEWQHVAYPAIIGQWGDAIVGEDAKRMLPAGCRLEMRDGCCKNPTHWMPIPAAPAIPAIPGTKEGA